MKDIKGYENEYAITEDGKVWSYRLNKFMKAWDNGAGYLKVRLKRNGCSTAYYIHRLVAETFIPNPEGLPEVNHKDENKSNNAVNNLEWCTAYYNNRYGSRTNRLVACQCTETKCIYDSVAEAARANNTHATAIHACCRGKTKTANGLHWQYLKEV